MVVKGTESIVIYGGKDENKRLVGDVWEFNLNSNMWSEMATSNSETPPARCWHAMAAKPNGAALYVFGGFDGKNDRNDLWRLSLADSLWIPMKPTGQKPFPRDRHSMVLRGDELVVFGGYVGTYTNDLWVFSIPLNQWTSISIASSPPKRRSHGSALSNDKMFVFGGFNGDRYLSDLWEFDFAESVWTAVRNSKRPSRRAGAILTSDSNALLFLFGGFDGVSAKSDLWRHEDGEGWTKVSTAYDCPLDRFAFGMAFQKSLYATDKGRLFVHGGMMADGGAKKLNDVFKYEIASNQWRQLIPLS